MQIVPEIIAEKSEPHDELALDFTIFT